MPKKSEGQELIAEVFDLLAVAVLEQEFDEDLGGHAPVDMWEELFPVESNVEDLFELLQMILSRRYLSPRENIQRSHEFAGEFFMNLPDNELKQLTRMTRPAFDRVCPEI
ncbi:hypothetical protein PPTG_19183 [Phytophthora nicotianae INRA-310]|uniref:Uncharacterized protein n=1 Tax=Phytophthora nicotianae (strain INRA-310) TaxID=761204 RepID=W2PFX1_PHYN3|nr:hypothetical protein PPTG_19183 [Phytophthora nicotianae INRA-310]ETM98904.1 hypothetical protein PPTG_19183 [Phytophthora nicotianae INRA-310]